VREMFKWKQGDPLPVSPIDGHAYTLEELTHSDDGHATFTRKCSQPS
jgi:hypothetical protein